ncbi:MAG: hypothetical protein HC945_02150 [Nitrosarchaeum sp.]|nr:hypothetical protein [Nitrosarchaeum sp.]
MQALASNRKADFALVELVVLIVLLMLAIIIFMLLPKGATPQESKNYFPEATLEHEITAWLRQPAQHPEFTYVRTVADILAIAARTQAPELAKAELERFARDQGSQYSTLTLTLTYASLPLTSHTHTSSTGKYSCPEPVKYQASYLSSYARALPTLSPTEPPLELTISTRCYDLNDIPGRAVH